MKRASACLSLSVWRRLWQTRAVDKSGTPPCATRRACLLKSWRGLRSFACVSVCNIEDGGREGGRRAGVCSNASASGVSCSWETFGFPLFARGSFEVRSWLQKRCRCRGGLGGAKLQAAENQRKSVLFFARGSMCDFCVWFLPEWAHLCGVGLPGQVQGLCVRTGAG